jgi:hypothetical protein
MRTEVSRGGGGKEVVNMGGDGAEVFLGRDLLLDVEMVEMVESCKQVRGPPRDYFLATPRTTPAEGLENNTTKFTTAHFVAAVQSNNRSAG